MTVDAALGGSNLDEYILSGGLQKDTRQQGGSEAALQVARGLES